jgi:hypothetical protein
MSHPARRPSRLNLRPAALARVVADGAWLLDPPHGRTAQLLRFPQAAPPTVAIPPHEERS